MVIWRFLPTKNHKWGTLWGNSFYLFCPNFLSYFLYFFFSISHKTLIQSNWRQSLWKILNCKFYLIDIAVNANRAESKTDNYFIWVFRKVCSISILKVNIVFGRVDKLNMIQNDPWRGFNGFFRRIQVIMDVKVIMIIGSCKVHRYC